MPRQPKKNRVLKSAFMCVCLVASSFSMLFAGQLAGGLPVQTALAASPNGLVINEVYDAANAGNEYFELYNTSATTINLSTYEVYNRDGSTPLSGLADPTIGPGEFRGIGPTQLGTSTIGGPTGFDANDFLALVNTSPTDQTIDVVNWGGAPNLNWPNYDRFSDDFFRSNIPNMPPTNTNDTRSLQRWPDGVDTDQGGDWQQIQRSPDDFSCADPYEDRDANTGDNSFDRPVLQGVGSQIVVLHRICPGGDVDFTGIDVSTSLTYTVRVSATAGSLLTPVLRIFDPNRGEVAVDADTTTPGTATISFRPTVNGRYRAQVSDVSNRGDSGPQWLYQINITATGESTGVTPSPTATGCLDVWEPDDVLLAAREIILNSEQVHLLCKPDRSPDTDWVTFTASGGKVFSFITRNLAGPVDTVISLHTADGTKLMENDDATPGQGLGSRIDYTFGGTGRYYLRIRDKNNSSGAGFQYTVAFESTGALPPTATASATSTLSPFSPTPTPGQCFDAYEPDGVPETAKLMYIASTQTHSICPVGDADWIRFYGARGKVYTIRTLNLGVGMDTYMWIFDGAGEMLGYDDDGGGEGVSSRIDFYPQADAFYFVQIKNMGDLGGTEQTYDVSLAVAAGVPLPAGTATFVIAPVVTVTSEAEPTRPAATVAPTQPPLSSPTREGTDPTPLREDPPATPVVPPAQPTTPPTVPVQVATSTTAPEEVPLPTDTAEPDTTDVEPTTVVVIPGVPPTGAQSDEPKVIVLPTTVSQKSKDIIAAPKPPEPKPEPEPQQLGTDYAPMHFRVFYDRNLNDTFDTGEGIKGINIFFMERNAKNITVGSVLTADNGSGRTSLPKSEQRIVVPYLGIDMLLTRFPERELHSLWLPKVSLPQQVP